MRFVTTGVLYLLLLSVYQVMAGNIIIFDEETTYTYDYEGRIATGIYQNNAKHFSGFGIKCQLKVYTKNAKVYFKFQETKMGFVNVDVDDFFEPIDINYSKPEFEDLKKAAIEIEKPFIAVYEDEIFQLYFDPDDSHSNWRKAVVGLFQTQFNPAGKHNPKYYKLYEDGVGGVCNTSYNIASIPSEQNLIEDVLNVTKVRFYDECESRPYYFISAMYGSKCGNCKTNMAKALKTFGCVEYGIKVNGKQLTIEKIHASGSVSFTPFTSNGLTVISFDNQTLSLVSTTKEKNHTEVDVGDYKSVTSLSYKFYPDAVEDVRQVKNLYYNRIFKQPIVENVVARVVKKVERVARCKDGCNEADKLIMLLYDLYMFEFENYVELFENHVNFASNATKLERTIRSVLLGVLPCVGTNAALKYMLELSEQHKVNKYAASEMLSVFPHYAKELYHDAIDILQVYLSKDAVKDYLNTWHAGLLAYGTLVHKACVHDDMHPHIIREYIDEERCPGYIKMLRGNYYNVASTKPKDALVYLKALLNTYHPDSYEIFMDVLQNAELPVSLRQIAIWGVERFVDTKHEEVTGVVASIFFDSGNDYVLRIYAFEVLIQSLSTPEFYSNLILSLEEEPDEKVASYIFSYLNAVANTSDPCYKRLNENARYVLHFVKPQKEYETFAHSRTGIFSSFIDKYKYGRSTKYSFIPSVNSSIPREFYITQSFNVMDYSLQFFEVGLTADEGNVLSSGAANEERSDFLDALISKLHLGKTNQPDDDPRYQLYMKMFGHDLKFTHQFDLHDSNEIVIQGSEINYDIHRISVTEVEYYVPNEMGFPVIFTLKVPTSTHLDGRGTFQLLPSEGLTLNVNIDAKLRVEFLVKARMFVYTPVLRKYGYELNTKGRSEFPLNGSVEIDTHSKKFAMKFTQATEPYDIFDSTTTSLSIAPSERIPIKYSGDTFNKKFKLNRALKYNSTWNGFSSYAEFLETPLHRDTTPENSTWSAYKWFSKAIEFIDYASINPTANLFSFHLEMKSDSNSKD